MSYGTTRGPL